jgi:membrane-bound lytic murein transglycosylase A
VARPPDIDDPSMAHPSEPYAPTLTALASLASLAVACASRPLTFTAATYAPEPTRAVVRAPPPPPREAPPASPFDALPGWRDDAIAAVMPAWRRTCERLARAPAERPVGRERPYGTVADWRVACASMPAEGSDDGTVRAYFERAFVPVALSDGGNPTGLFTGYYEPLLHGARVRSARYGVPLYARPRDLVAGARGVGRRVRGRWVRYWTRGDIARGALRRSAPVLAWVEDGVEAFFLEIQGSGRVAFEDGTSLFLNYAGDNGHPYTAIGRELVARGAIARDAVSLQSIRAWLAAHPREAQAVMNTNASYVFFRPSEDGGSHGAEGVTLTPGRSLAVDPRHVPFGVPLFVDIEALEGVGPIRRLVVAQDTGGAIRGAVRGDLFWGAGPDAYDRAGRMRQRGRYWMLVPRGLDATERAPRAATVVSSPP